MMTTQKTTTLFILSILSLLFFEQCGNKSSVQTEAERASSLLKANTWKIQSVQVDGVDQTALFKGLTLTWGDGSYTATNGGVVWPASGTWKWVDETAKSFTRQDNVVVTITTLTETSLALNLTWTKTVLSGGKVTSVAGNHSFIFGK